MTKEEELQANAMAFERDKSIEFEHHLDFALATSHSAAEVRAENDRHEARINEIYEEFNRIRNQILERWS